MAETNDGRVVPDTIESVQNEAVRQMNRFKAYGDTAKLKDDDSSSFAYYLAVSAFATIYEMLETVKKAPPATEGTSSTGTFKRPSV
jgi:hypothetical protein